MKKSCISNIIAASVAAALFSAWIPVLPASCENTARLTIAQVQLSEEALAEQDTVEVTVSIADNEAGFLAASFGISYDSSLVLTDVTTENAAGSVYVYASNPDKDLIWFTGASADADSVADSDEETMFVLTFTLPEDAAAGDEYPICFTYEALNSSQAFWYTENHTNIIGNIHSLAQDGCIRIQETNPVMLSDSEMQVNIGETKMLSVLNSENSVLWFSDNTKVAEVTDGIVTGIASGTCRIYASTENALLVCEVTVTEESYYDITQTDIVYLTDPEKTVYLSYPESGQTITWISENTDIVTVTDGLLCGIENGTATIYAICGSKVYTTQVIVAYPVLTEYSPGDINLDGSVSILDVVLLNRNLLGITQLNETQIAVADVLTDGSITSADCLLVMKYVVHLVDTLPVSP